jgi:hypothetical protein
MKNLLIALSLVSVTSLAQEFVPIPAPLPNEVCPAGAKNARIAEASVNEYVRAGDYHKIKFAAQISMYCTKVLGDRIAVVREVVESALVEKSKEMFKSRGFGVGQVQQFSDDLRESVAVAIRYSKEYSLSRADTQMLSHQYQVRLVLAYLEIANVLAK